MGRKSTIPISCCLGMITIYVIETKGELLFGTKKNALLRRLNNVGPIGDIKGFKGLLIYSQQMDITDLDTLNFDQFVERCEKDA
jgi:hypothetical protein